MRQFLWIILPLVAPAVVFFLQGWLRGKFRQTTGSEDQPAAKHPWLQLALAGVICVIVALLTQAFVFHGGEGGSYIAPRWENGQITPGHYAPAKE